jgi:hypothetical protein
MTVLGVIPEAQGAAVDRPGAVGVAADTGEQVNGTVIPGYGACPAGVVQDD